MPAGDKSDQTDPLSTHGPSSRWSRDVNSTRNTSFGGINEALPRRGFWLVLLLTPIWTLHKVRTVTRDAPSMPLGGPKQLANTSRSTATPAQKGQTGPCRAAAQTGR